MLRSLFLTLLFSLVTLLPSYSAVSLSSGLYEQNFNTSLGSEWTLSGLGLVDVFAGGYSASMNTGSGNGKIAEPGTGTAPTLETGGVAPIVAPRSYSEFGFSGKWLTNHNATSGVRSAKVSFTDLGSHDGIQLSFLLGLGDSIDNGEGVLELYLDNQLIFRRDANGGSIASSPGNVDLPDHGPASLLTTYATNANLNSYYQEKWNNNASNPSNRYAQSWTLDAAYGFDGWFAHTADTLTLEWRILSLDQTYTDEFIAFDQLRLHVVPEPSQALLCVAAGFLALIRRRR